MERPGRLENVAHIVELRGRRLHLDRLTVFPGQSRLGIERVELRRAAIHEQEDDILGLGREVRQTDVGGCCAAGPALLGQHAGQGDSAKPVGAAAQHLPASHRFRKKLAAMHAFNSTDEDEFLHIQKHVTQIGPALPGLRGTCLIVLHELSSCLEFLRRWRPTERFQVKAVDSI